jgi:phosphate-selective porin OprO and OprP
MSVAVQTASAQPAPSQEPPGSSPAPQPQPLSPATPPSAVASGGPTEAELEERIQQLESMVKTLSTKVGQRRGPSGPGTAAPNTGTPATATAPSAMGGAGAPDQSLPPDPPPAPRFNMPATLENLPGKVKFGPGFEIRTNDDEYIFQFHNLTQFDYRGYQQGGQTPVRDTFFIPRQWFMFSGRLTQPIGYFVSFANNISSWNILDVFADVDIDPRLRFRIGRFKTPFTYEFLVEPIQGLVVPERSIFFNNFGQNRDEGIMPFGRLFNNKVDYAGGIFNGTRNGFLAQQDGKFTSWFINYRPFGDEENTLLENFNIGGSVFAGNMAQAPIPGTSAAPFRTVVPTTGDTTIGVPFLTLNNNVRQSGPMAFWDLHLAYFYRQLAVIGEWGSGYQDYALASSLRARTKVPVEAFYIQASYFLTGETRSSLGIVKPNHPFDLRKGKFGTGAIEPFFRYEYLDIGSQVFTNGLADPNLWANRVFQTHVGVNWHLTQYIKLYFDWNHAEFNEPVLFAPGRRQKTSDMALIRVQIFF